MLRGGRLLARALARQGVGRVFGLCGDHINPIFEGLADEGIAILDARDERGAGHMAEGWALATGEPGVCIVTGGPGLLNALSAIANASLAGTPMAVVTSRIRLAETGRGYPQDLDQMSAVRPFTVSARTIFDPERIPAEVAETLTAARARRGPAVLEMPLDIQLAATAEQDPPPPVPLPAPFPDPEALDTAARMLGEAERPVLIAGEGCFWSGAAGPLRRLAEEAGIPVFTVRAARGLLPDDHERCFGQPNFLRGTAQAAFNGADLLLVAGCELDIVLAFGAPAPGALLVRLERDPARAVRSRRPDVALVGDEAAGLAALADRVAGRATPTAWLAELRSAAAEEARGSTAARTADGSPVHPARLVAEVAAAVAPRGTVTVDAGALALWALEGIPATGPGRLLTSFGTPFSTLGAGIPYALAAALARPDEPAVALVGDGSFGFTALEIDTAARHRIPIVVAVGNDAAWGIVKRQMEITAGRSVAADLAARDYAAVAAALGASGERAADAAAVGPALRRALAAGGPAVVDIPLDREPEHHAMPFIAALFAPRDA